MNQKQLIECITTELQASGLPISKHQVDAVLMKLAETATRALIQGDVVRIPRLGMLAPVHRMARKGCHPTTGELLEFPPKTAVKFRPLQQLKDAVSA